MRLFASALYLDPPALKALAVTDAYSLHRVVYSLYEDVRDEESKLASKPSGILYADHGGDARGRRILMLADRPPADAVNGRYGHVQRKEVPEHFLAHDYYRFKVIVNPTRRDRTSRRLIPVKGREGVAQWFAERAPSRWGFVVEGGTPYVDRIEVLQFSDKAGRNVTISQAHVRGWLRVADRERFINSFSRGIGRARTFGCGLLQITPIIDNPFS